MVLAVPAAMSVSFVRQIDCMLRLRVGMLFTSLEIFHTSFAVSAGLEPTDGVVCQEPFTVHRAGRAEKGRALG